jgi:hypothetical protein
VQRWHSSQIAAKECSRCPAAKLLELHLGATFITMPWNQAIAALRSSTRYEIVEACYNPLRLLPILAEYLD